MLAPAFWQRRDHPLARLLAPASLVYAAATARRVARPGWVAPAPVICCGNVTVGGSGKTTLALDLAPRLQRRGVVVHFLTRGYGGRASGVVRVAPDHAASEVGDEALLLAERAPTWVSADRAAGARAAIAAGAGAIVMDDGLQNPGLVKTVSLLVIDGGAGFGNGRILPAGPLREPVLAGAARCRAAVLIGGDMTGAAAQLPSGLPVLHARIEPAPDMHALAGRRVLAFSGIGRPEKFFDSLSLAGAELAGRLAFADHHPFRSNEIKTIIARAERLAAVPVTTAKDAARIDGELRTRLHVARVSLRWQEPDQIEALLDRALASTPAAGAPAS